MNEYDIEKAFAAIEEELIASMMRNMQRHKDWETEEGFRWTMWQAEQLKALEKYKRQNKKKFERRFNEINGSIKMLVEQARQAGGLDQELEILEAIEQGWKLPKARMEAGEISSAFFALNTRKLNALIKATESDFAKAETAMLRMAEDQYRQVIFNAQVYANTGAGTYEKAVDMATRDFLSRGINCIEYANGARHRMKDYAMMAIRTASKRAYLTGEGEKRQEWGISTVIMNKRGNPCPKCLPFVGKILIDDVWSGGSAEDGPYPLMSSAVAAGLYHPNCKDSHSTYFEGISTPPDDKFTEEEIEQIEEQYRLEQKRQYAQRQVEKYRRLANGTLDEEEKKKYKARMHHWEKVEYLRNNMPKQYIDNRHLGEKINRDELNKFIKKANSYGIQIGTIDYPTGGFEYYRGDKEVLDDILESLHDSMENAKANRLYKGKVILKYENVLGYKGDKSMVDIDAFAITQGRTVTLNKFMFDDSQYLKNEYNAAVTNGIFAKGTGYKNIVQHEFGHIVDSKNKNLQKKATKVLSELAKYDNLSLTEYIINNISEYASSIGENAGEWPELIPELMAQSFGNNPDFAIKVLSEVGVKNEI